MDQHTHSILIEVAGILSDASKKVMDLLRGAPTARKSPAPASTPESDGSTETSALDRLQEFEPGPKVQGEEPRTRRRAKRGSFNPTKEDLGKLREQYTAKEIGAQFGVSAQTVAIRAKALGLTTPRGRKPMAKAQARAKRQSLN